MSNESSMSLKDWHFSEPLPVTPNRLQSKILDLHRESNTEGELLCRALLTQCAEGVAVRQEKCDENHISYTVSATSGIRADINGRLEYSFEPSDVYDPYGEDD